KLCLLGIRVQAVKLSPYRSGPAAPRSSYLDTATAFLACYCPRISFRLRVSHQTQEYPSEFLPAELGIWQGASWRRFLLLGIHADHRLPSGLDLPHQLTDEPELAVPVGVLLSPDRLGVALQAVTILPQQPPHSAGRDRMARRRQLAGQLVRSTWPSTAAATPG